MAVQVDDFLQLNLLCRRQAMLEKGQSEQGSHRFDEPVSKRTLKFWGGVPTDRAP